jgi:Na+-transporting methylmalonyl-CoA/oxaloacetate decarboxylase gamma subunit
MNIETMEYAVLTTVVGITIVFSILVILSLLMVLIKKVFDEKEAKPAGKAAAPAAVKTVSTEAGLPAWLSLAVAAFEALEAEDLAPNTAASWTPSEAEKTNAWLAQAVLRK